jgi:hypothetical protein
MKLKGLLVTTGDSVSGEAGARSMVEHCGGELAHEGLCLKVEVAQRGIDMPSIHHMNGVVVNLTTQEGYVTTIT